MYVIGLGTGRCGTTSLSKLLQKVGLSVPHELRPVVNWSTGKAKDRLNLIKSLNLDGDVAFWYLNLVEDMNKISENIRFICLERNIDEVVYSYLNKTIGRNHWINHDGTRWHKDPIWDQCYPKYNIVKKSEAIRLYCEEYQRRSREFEKNMDNFKIFHINSLNSKSGVQSILKFLNIDKKLSEDIVNIRCNENPKCQINNYIKSNKSYYI
tara:strand:- start:47 stop:676 length:630 start_codon:yes stop_codon:yes gene_type:complete